MANKKFWVGMLVMVLVFGMAVVGCDTGNNTQPNIYTVTFDADNGTPPVIQTVIEGSSATRPANPTREGHSFGYWFNEATDEEWDFETPVIADINLRAKWDLSDPITRDWEWIQIPHSPTKDSHEAYICKCCGEIAGRRDVPATPNFTWYGDGSAESFSIATPQSMFGFAHIVNGTAQEYGGPTRFNFDGRVIHLSKNIDLDSIPWTPIGDTSEIWNATFNGTFDGNGYAIVGLYVNRPDAVGNGLFGALPGIVENLFVSGAVVGRSTSGGLVGEPRGGIIRNTHAHVSVTSIDATAGGLVGFLNTGSIENSFATGDVSANRHAGGLVGSVLAGAVAAVFTPFFFLLLWRRKYAIIIQNENGEQLCVIKLRRGETLEIETLKRALGKHSENYHMPEEGIKWKIIQELKRRVTLQEK